MRSAIQQNDFGKEANEKHGCDRGQDQPQSQVLLALLWRHGLLTNHAGRRSVELGRCLEGVERRWRWDFPLQALSSFPWLSNRFFTMAEHRRQDNEEEEIDLRKSEEKSADRSNHVEVSELHGVVSVAAWHTG